MWKNGSTARMRSPGPMGMTGVSWARLVAMEAWVSMTPLGTPVVPEEYGRAATSRPGSMSISGTGSVEPRKSWSDRTPSLSSARSQTKISAIPPASSAAARAEASSGETVTIHRADESLSCFANSSGVASGCTVVTEAPARVAA